MTSVVINGQAPIRLVLSQTPGVGAAGVGVPVGGSTGQVLAKNSATDYDTEWVSASGVGDLLAANNLSDVASASTALSNLGGVPTARTISTTAPLTGGGDLSANRTLAVSAASSTAAGVVELATDAETITGTDTARAVTPANVAAAYVAKSLADAKGDLFVASAADTVTRLAVGTNDYVLTADSAQATGVKWAAAAGGGGGISAAFPHYGRAARADVFAGITNGYLPLSCMTGSVSNAGASLAQRPFWWPFILDRPMVVSAVATWCWASEASSTLRAGFYACDDEWVPTTLLADYGTMSGASTGAKTVTGTTEIPAGLFSLCLWPSNHTTVRWSKPSVGTPLAFGETSQASGTYNLGWRLQSETADYSAGLPASITASTLYPFTVATNPIVAYLRFEAP